MQVTAPWRQLSRHLLLAVLGVVLIAAALWLAVVRATAARASVPAPVLIHSAYEREAVECRGTNQDGTSCRNKTKNLSGYCYRHAAQVPHATQVVNLTPGK